MSLLKGTHTREIIVFGTGVIGKTVVQLLERQYHILFVVDNDETKWGNLFENYPVKSPQELLEYNRNIVIASSKYMQEISLQLCRMGIPKEKVFFCDAEAVNGSVEYIFYPLDAKKAEGTGKSLIQYDLLEQEEQETNNKKVLLYCSFYSVYTKQLIENISKRYTDIEFSILTRAKENKEKIKSEWLSHIYFFQTKSDLKTIFEQLPIYDDVHLLWMENDCAYIYEFIRKKSKHLILNIGGSDFYRAGNSDRDYKKNLIMCADRIMAQTPDTADKFISYYGAAIASKVQILPYGAEVLDFIKSKGSCSKEEIKKKYGIPADKIVVTCGHNAGKAHQHIDMINAINKLPKLVKEKMICLVPMTYPAGQEKYIENVRNRLNSTGLDYVILTRFMDFQSMAEYARMSDIMIHVQTTDQLSSAMLEEMYAGSIVIAGSWLPYKSLHTNGIYFLDVNEIDDLAEMLEEVLTNIERYKEKCRVNKDIIWKKSSWDELAPMWHALWN